MRRLPAALALLGLLSSAASAAPVIANFPPKAASGLTSVTTSAPVSGDGSPGTPVTIADSAVALSKLAAQADQTILCNNTGGVASAVACTAAQTRTVLSIQASSAVNITGGSITGLTTFALPGSMSTGVVLVTTTTGAVLTATLTGLTATATTLTNDLITGKSGGQTVVGDTAASGNLLLSSTSDGTKNQVRVGGSGLLNFIESTGQILQGSTSSGSSARKIEQIYSNNTNIIGLYVSNTSTGNVADAEIDIQAQNTLFRIFAFSANVAGAANQTLIMVTGSTGDVVFAQHQTAGDFVFQTTTSDTERFRIQTGGLLKLGAASTATNGTQAMLLGSTGPAAIAAPTACARWFKVKDSGNTDTYLCGWQ